MTTRNQPHKYRCETCEYNDETATSKCPAWQFNKFLVPIIGCASHSSVGKADQRLHPDDIPMMECFGEAFDESYEMCQRCPQNIFCKQCDIQVKRVLVTKDEILVGKEKVEQRIKDVIGFVPNNTSCPNLCLCPLCKNKKDCESPCEIYAAMAGNCKDCIDDDVLIERCEKRLALLRGEGE